MTITPLQKFFGKVAAVSGSIQGFTWSILSLICIVQYYTFDSNRGSINSYIDELSLGIGSVYLDRRNTRDDLQVIQPKDFHIIMWFYLIISLTLLASSAMLFNVIYRNRGNEFQFMFLWGGVMGCNALVDLIVTSLLFKDYRECDLFDNSILFNNMCYNIIGIVATLAARGYLLWFLNVLLAVRIIYQAMQIYGHYKLKESVRTSMPLPRATIQARQTPWMQPGAVEPSPMQLGGGRLGSTQPRNVDQDALRPGSMQPRYGDQNVGRPGSIQPRYGDQDAGRLGSMQPRYGDQDAGRPGSMQPRYGNQDGSQHGPMQQRYPEQYDGRAGPAQQWNHQFPGQRADHSFMY